jgi:anti-sigma factor RsiW
MKQTPEQLEFAISQYLDGTLLPLETAALEERLAVDADARALLEEYRRTDELLRAGAGALPEIAWDRFAAHLSGQVEQVEAPAAPTLKLRFGLLPRIAAVAASIVVAFGAIWLVTHRSGGDGRPGNELTAAPNHSEITVEVASTTPTTGPALAEISVEQPTAGAPGGPMQNWHADAIITRPSSVLIAPDQPAAQDTDDLPQ